MVNKHEGPHEEAPQEDRGEQGEKKEINLTSEEIIDIVGGGYGHKIAGEAEIKIKKSLDFWQETGDTLALSEMLQNQDAKDPGSKRMAMRVLGACCLSDRLNGRPSILELLVKRGEREAKRVGE